MKQPALGVTATLGIILISFLTIFALGPELFMNWASYALMGAIPFAIVVGAFWQGKEPAAIANLGQPVRGVAYLVLAALVAAVVSVIHWATRGGALPGNPIPMAVMTIITSVVVTFFLVIVWGGWPFSLIRNKLVAGIVVLVGAYVINALIFQLMNFSFAQGAPFYSDALEPGGPISAWTVVVVMVTALSVMFLTLHFQGGKPFTNIKSDPLRGLVWTVACFVVGYLVFLLGTQVAGMEAPTFMVQVSIPFLFGSIVMLNMLGGSITAKLSPVVGGIVSVVLAAIVGKLLALGYSALMPLVSGAMPAGPEGNFAAELWLANALLAVTFPFLAFYGDFFQLWPLAGKKPAEPAAEPVVSAVEPS
ncbi:hypothetical protein AADG42_17875 [Ammonicoccus fulvus]|uniref:Uncharacterized protein n=1 Tax=Ammonicoccus fulvus TaxID=3138240 RepID=A0ABZ3FSQ7_9ACTN